MSNGSSSTTQGLYGVTRETLPIPRRFTELGSEMYVNAYRLGYQMYALQHAQELKDDALRSRDFQAAKMELSKCEQQPRNAASNDKINKAQREVDLEEARIEERNAKQTIEKPALKEEQPTPGEKELIEDWKHVYRDAFIAGWEASAFAYWKGAARKAREIATAKLVKEAELIAQNPVPEKSRPKTK